MNTSLMIVHGNSMNCVLMKDDVVLVKLGALVRPGDIFVYYSHGNHIIHRVLFVGLTRVWETGDNNYRIKAVKKDAIVGKVVANITQKKCLDSSKLNRKIAGVNFIRCFFGKKITTVRSLVKNKNTFQLIVWATKYRNQLQKQYRDMGD